MNGDPVPVTLDPGCSPGFGQPLAPGFRMRTWYSNKKRFFYSGCGIAINELSLEDIISIEMINELNKSIFSKRYIIYRNLAVNSLDW